MKREEALDRISQLLQRGGPGAVKDVVAALAKWVPPYSWVGIYVVRDGMLVLGPWNGPQATEHTRIPIGSGICGAAAKSSEAKRMSVGTRGTCHVSCRRSRRSWCRSSVRGWWSGRSISILRCGMRSPSWTGIFWRKWQRCCRRISEYGHDGQHSRSSSSPLWAQQRFVHHAGLPCVVLVIRFYVSSSFVEEVLRQTHFIHQR